MELLLITEKDFMATVVALAQAQGWAVYHTHNSRRSAPGFPDLVLLRPPRLLFAELKTEKGRLTLEQKRWLNLLGRCPGVETHLWRPASWPEIERRLL